MTSYPYVTFNVIFFKVGSNTKEIKLLIEMKAHILPLGQRSKIIGRERSKAGPYFCLTRGGFNESVFHLMGECEELNDWRIKVSDKEHFDFESLLIVSVDVGFNSARILARFFRLAMDHIARFL